MDKMKLSNKLDTLKKKALTHCKFEIKYNGLDNGSRTFRIVTTP